DGAHELGPFRCFLVQAFAAGRREPVDLRPAVVLRRLPLRVDPALQLETLQRRVQRTELDAEPIARAVANRADDGVAVQRTEQERPQNQEVEHAVEGFHIERLYIKTVCIWQAAAGRGELPARDPGCRLHARRIYAPHIHVRERWAPIGHAARSNSASPRCGRWNFTSSSASPPASAMGTASSATSKPVATMRCRTSARCTGRWRAWSRAA